MGHGFNAAGRMCPLPRSLAAEANGCFMVRTRTVQPTTRLRRNASRAMAGSPRFVFYPPHSRRRSRSTFVYTIVLFYAGGDAFTLLRHEMKQCHGAHCGQGPSLAMLAVLRRRCLARGSAWLRFSPDLRCAPRPRDGVGTKGVPPFQPVASGTGRTKGCFRELRTITTAQIAVS